MSKLLLTAMLLLSATVLAAPREVDDHHWIDVERIVAIGDLHGDFDGYMHTLQAAELVDQSGRWSGGDTHLVQTGDIPDRGPDTRKIIEHMAKLARQARKQGGRVHNLIGNHEAMNVYGDLRYVTDGEYQAFANDRSQKLRENYYEAVLQNIAAQQPKKFKQLPDDHRQLWMDSHPPGWIEHRQAWNPNWSDDGTMYQWVAAARVAVQINDTIFVHGGISGHYCLDTLASMTARAREKLQRSDPSDLGILTDQYGPLWYRGLAGKAPEAADETVEAILRQHQAARIVVGHTPTGGYIWPRYQGRVIQIDTGIGAAYGGHVAYLEINHGKLFAGYHGGSIALPSEQGQLIDYMAKVTELLPDNQAARSQLTALQVEQQSTTVGSDNDKSDEDDNSKTQSADEQAGPVVPICGTRL